MRFQTKTTSTSALCVRGGRSPKFVNAADRATIRIAAFGVGLPWDYRIVSLASTTTSARIVRRLKKTQVHNGTVHTHLNIRSWTLSGIYAAEWGQPHTGNKSWLHLPFCFRRTWSLVICPCETGDRGLYLNVLHTFTFKRESQYETEVSKGSRWLWWSFKLVVATGTNGV